METPLTPAPARVSKVTYTTMSADQMEDIHRAFDAALPRVESDAAFKPLLDRRHTHGKLRGKPGTPGPRATPDGPRKKRPRRGRAKSQRR